MHRPMDEPGQRRSNGGESGPREAAVRRLFCVDSCGATATAWLAATLNGLPGVVCAHSFSSPLSYPTFENPEGAAGDLWHADRVEDLDEVFELLLAAHPEAVCVGTVHPLPAHASPRWSGREPVRGCHLLRHPVLQIESLTERWLERAQREPAFLERALERLGERAARSLLAHLVGAGLLERVVAARAGPGDLLWLACAMEVTESHARTLARPDVPVFTMERICSGAEDLEELLGFVTAGLVEDLGPAVRRALACGPLPREGQVPRTPASVLASWPPARRELWKAVAASTMGERYRRLGYEDVGSNRSWRSSPGAATQLRDGS